MRISTHATEDHFSEMARQMSRWVERVLKPGYHNYCPAESWAPSVNAFEDETHYCLVVDLAGVNSGQIDLRVEGERQDVLVITGNRQPPGVPEAGGKVRLHLMEIDSGPFCRRLAVPDNVDSEKIEARYRNGFLWIRMPKKD